MGNVSCTGWCSERSNQSRKGSTVQAKLFMTGKEEPVAVLDDVRLMEYNDNHKQAPLRIYYTSRSLNAGKTMLEMHRDEQMLLRMEDGRSADVLLQHNSMDSSGNAVGVLRVLGPVRE